jgi:hypothetical protein
MTEDEAKTKWCPMVRNGVNRNYPRQGYQGEIGDNNPPYSKCIASDCMMWRVTRNHNSETGESFVTGYCGLGGKP